MGYPHSPHHLSNLPFLRGNKGGKELLFTCVQIGTFTIGLILIVVDLVLSNPFFTLFPCFPEPAFPSSVVTISARELEEDDVEEEDDDGDR